MCGAPPLAAGAVGGSGEHKNYYIPGGSGQLAEGCDCEGEPEEEGLHS